MSGESLRTPDPGTGAAPQPKVLILSIYGAFVRRMGGWMAVADLIALMADLGFGEQPVRSATSRMKRSGLLEAEQRPSGAGYTLTEAAEDILGDGDTRIYNGQETDLADGWVLVAFSVPEHERDQRYTLRSRLVWLGFGQLNAGVWIAPRHRLTDVQRMLERLDLTRYATVWEAAYAGFDRPEELIARTWELDQLAELYTQFLRQFSGVAERWQLKAGAPVDAFRDYLFVLSAWRRLPFMDPGLPTELLPADWAGARGRALFSELVEVLEPLALTHVQARATHR